MKKLLLVPIIFFVFSPLILQAQSSSSEAGIKNTIGIGPRLGYYKAADADNGSFFGGAQLRARLGQYFGIEAAVEYRAANKYEVGQQSFKTSFVPVTASALLFLPISENFAPYGVAGLGAYYTIYDADGIFESTDNEFNLGYHLGFGLEIPVNDNVALNADYRYLFINPNDNQESFDGDFSGNVFTAGLMFYL